MTHTCPVCSAEFEIEIKQRRQESHVIAPPTTDEVKDDDTYRFAPEEIELLSPLSIVAGRF